MVEAKEYKQITQTSQQRGEQYVSAYRLGY